VSLAIVGAALIGGNAVLSKGPHPVHVGFGGPASGEVASTGGPCGPAAYAVGAQYTFERCTDAGAPVGWTRCSKVTYSVDPASAPPGFAVDLDRALAQLQAATGLHLVPVAGSADIPISWDPSLYDPVPGTTGEAGVTYVHWVSGPPSLHLTSAEVRISSHLVSGTAARLGEEAVLLHELGHAVGLGHYQGAVVMNPLDQGFDRYQGGDVAGLAALYRPSSCRP
jgi:hypothetical protein